MMNKTGIDRNHPLRKLFRSALEFGLEHNPTEKDEVAYYLEEQVLCEFMNADSLFKIKDADERRLEDIGEMLSEGSILMNAHSFEREFEVHKHIGDFTLFMLGMFPLALSTKKGREFILGKLVVPGGSLSDHYMLQGQRSYRIASEFTHEELFLELSSNFMLYMNILEMARIYLITVSDDERLGGKGVISGSA